jgi:hypothetical protein
MAKLTPAAPAADLPQNFWGKILTMTPVVMTVVATVLAGLSNSEMTQSQYHRTMAAEVQSKAGDQWGFFQAKKTRGLTMHDTAEVLEATANVSGYELGQQGTLESKLDRVDKTGDELLGRVGMHSDIAEATSLNSTIETMGQRLAHRRELIGERKNELAKMRPATMEANYSSPAAWHPKDAAVKAASEAIAGLKPDEEIAPLVATVTAGALAEELRSAMAYTHELDAAFRPAASAVQNNQAVVERTFLAWQMIRGDADAVREMLGDPFRARLLPVDVRNAAQDFVAACDDVGAMARRSKAEAAAMNLGVGDRRYEAEAQHNQAIALLYEIQVRVESALSDRHRARSQKFFFGMLGAQMAVVVSSLSLAMQRKNLLWSFAAAVGLAAMAFAGYVYLFV